MFYEERYSEVYLSPDLPDYVKWAESMGCVGIRVESPEEIQPAIDKANEIDDRPVVVEFRTDSRGEGLPDGPGRQVERRDPGARRSSRRRRGADDGRVAHAPRPADRPPPHHTLSVLVENKAGVLARVANLFARRGYNIFSLAVAPTDDERFSRITIVVDVESAPLEQIVKQLDKLVNVVEISELDPRTSVERELLLATVEAGPADRGARWSSWPASSRAASSP